MTKRDFIEAAQVLEEEIRNSGGLPYVISAKYLMEAYRISAVTGSNETGRRLISEWIEQQNKQEWLKHTQDRYKKRHVEEKINGTPINEKGLAAFSEWLGEEDQTPELVSVFFGQLLDTEAQEFATGAASPGEAYVMYNSDDHMMTRGCSLITLHEDRQYNSTFNRLVASVERQAVRLPGLDTTPITSAFNEQFDEQRKKISLVTKRELPRFETAKQFLTWKHEQEVAQLENQMRRIAP